MRKRGVFICFTGIDGSGKSTLAKFLIDFLKIRGIKSTYVYGRYTPIFLKVFIKIGNSFFLSKNSFFGEYSLYSNTKRKITKKHFFLAKIYQHLLLIDYFSQVIFKIKSPTCSAAAKPQIEIKSL